MMDWISPLADGHHPLFGFMDKRMPWQIESALRTRPPTKAQLDELAAEELAGKDRPDVWRIFERHKPK